MSNFITDWDKVSATVSPTVHVHVLMKDGKEGRKKQGQTNKQGKATQHAQGSHFSQENELPWVGLEHTKLYTLDMYMFLNER